jgi:hypothetical protein
MIYEKNDIPKIIKSNKQTNSYNNNNNINTTIIDILGCV